MHEAQELSIFFSMDHDASKSAAPCLATIGDADDGPAAVAARAAASSFSSFRRPSNTHTYCLLPVSDLEIWLRRFAAAAHSSTGWTRHILVKFEVFKKFVLHARHN